MHLEKWFQQTKFSKCLQSKSMNDIQVPSRIKSIDGLRAVAVILIILYHAKISIAPIPGGFVGVDIFYVISGYVVCKSIAEGINKNSFTLRDFYARRVLRLFPGLLVTLFLTCIASLYFFYPFDLQDFFKSIISINFLGANFWFWKENANYFNATSAYAPLIHTWSLAVEEQFYLVFPILTLMLNKYLKHYRVIIYSGATFAFLALTISLSSTYPNAVFYLLPFRIWEFGIGITVFYIKRNLNIRFFSRGLIINILQLTYLLLILLVSTRFNPLISNVMLIQVVTASATGLLIFFCHADSPFKDFLSTRPMVSIGVISYSAYLLHNPIFTFLLYSSQRIPSTPQLTVAFLLTFVGAWVVHRFVEKPIQKRYGFNQKSLRIIASWLAISVLFASISFIFISSKFAARTITSAEEQVLAFSQSNNDSRFEWKKCFLGLNDSPDLFSPSCAGNESNSQLLIFGDSHSAMIASALVNKVPGMARYSSSGCKPVLDVGGQRTKCDEVNSFVMSQILSLQPKAILIKTNWLGQSINGTFSKWFIQEFESTIKEIKESSPQSQIFIMGNTPQWLPSLPIVLVRSEISIDRQQWIYTPQISLLKKLDFQLEEIANSTNSHFISYLPNLCRADSCLAVASIADVTEPFAFDYGHTTSVGSEILANLTLIEIKSNLD
jgi:peptidoglycan/LPS O-acetylase OafA/YrhL